jgi:hypothetical protein
MQYSESQLIFWKNILPEAGSKQNLLHASFFLGLFCDPEDGGNVLLSKHRLVFTRLLSVIAWCKSIDISEEHVGFSPLHVVQTSSGAHPASYPLGTGGFFTVVKVAGV